MPARFKGEDGREVEVDESDITMIRFKDTQGREQDVEAHGYRAPLDLQPNAGGRRWRLRRDDGQEVEIDPADITMIRFKDENGAQQDVEGRRWHRA